MSGYVVDLATGSAGTRTLTATEIDDRDAQMAAFEAARPERERQAHNDPILAVIAELDSKRLRPSAEMALAFANGVAPDPADIARLNALTAEVAALRLQLLP